MLHDALKTIRVFHDLKQIELSDRLDISKSYLSEIESGKKVPTLPLLEKYSEVFNIPTSSILFFSESLNKDVPMEKARVLVSSKIIKLLKLIAKKSGKTDEK